jgi:hypothetical protein
VWVNYSIESALTGSHESEEHDKRQQRHDPGAFISTKSQGGHLPAKNDQQTCAQDSKKDRHASQYGHGSRDALVVARAGRLGNLANPAAADSHAGNGHDNIGNRPVRSHQSEPRRAQQYSHCLGANDPDRRHLGRRHQNICIAEFGGHMLSRLACLCPIGQGHTHHLEKLFSIPIACHRGVNVNESEWERSESFAGNFVPSGE